MGAMPFRGALELVDAMRRGALGQDEYFDDVIRELESRDRVLNAFLHFDAGEARESFESRSRTGLLSGLAVAVKDNIVTRGTETTCASRMLEGFRSPTDATVVRRLRGAGAWIAGKTNLDEFAMGSSTEFSAFGPTSNPWDLERVPGGSSGGSAAAVASAIVPVALGSDTGGSVRQPAAFTGILGLKPTWGRVSRLGLVAFASSLDQVGIFATSTDDLAAVLQVIAGHDPGDATSSPVAVPDYASTSRSGVRGRRLAVIPDIMESLDDDVRQSFDESVGLLRASGAEIREVAVPSMTLAIATYYIVANAEASANLARFDGVRYGLRANGAGALREMYVRSRSEGFGPEVKRRIMLGTFALSAGYYDAYYGRAQKVRQLMREELAAAFRQADLILTPTTPTPAFRKGEKLDDPLKMYLSDVFTAPANLAGVPALAIPSTPSREGLPLSIQVMGPPYDEGRLLAVSRLLEDERGGFARPGLR
jgi:aspartyl-tRNA(Asn)/glutamyl-tRNA(Gln) amidotransferase subunit A